MARASQAMPVRSLGGGGWLVKQFPEPGLSALVTVLTVFAMLVVVVWIILRAPITRRRVWRQIGHWRGCLGRHRTLDNLVEFPAVKPHAAALRSIINFHALSLRHDKVRLWANWAFHMFYCLLPPNSCCSCFVCSPCCRHSPDFTESGQVLSAKSLALVRILDFPKTTPTG